MKLRRFGQVVGLLLAASAGVVAVADVVTLSDGSKLLGTVKRLQDGKLILETKFAGTIEIDASSVTSIATDAPVNVGMASGDQLVGQIEWKEDIDRAVVQTEMGGVPIALDRLQAVWPPGDKSPAELAAEAEIADIRAQMEAERPKWTAVLEVGVFAKEGNTDELSVLGRGELQRKTLKDLLRFYVRAKYSEENDVRSDNEIIGGTYYEYLFTERLFAYWRLDLEYDEFENIDLRLSTVLGPGYYWIKEDAHELKSRFGVGYLHETYTDGRTEDDAQAEVGLEYRLDIAPWLRFTENASYFPTFSTIRDYRLYSDTAFIIPLGASDVWKLKLGALYEYKSMPDPGRERLDQTYYANILAELK